MCAFNLNWEGAPYSQFEMTAELKRRRVVDPVVYAPADGPLRAAYEREGISVHVATHPLAGVSTAADYDAAIDGFARLDPHLRRRCRLRQHAADVLRDRRRAPDRSSVDLESARERTVAGVFPPVPRCRRAACAALLCVSLPDRIRRPRDGRGLGGTRHAPQFHGNPQRPRPAAPRRGGRRPRARRRAARARNRHRRHRSAAPRHRLRAQGPARSRAGARAPARRGGGAGAHLLRRRPRERVPADVAHDDRQAARRTARAGKNRAGDR